MINNEQIITKLFQQEIIDDSEKKYITQTIDKLDEFIKLFYKKLRPGGTCIIFFDIWKLQTLKKLKWQ